MDGVFNIYKPSGLTSHDVVNRVRRALGIKRAGHTGTLDPQARGVLPVCVGKATRAAEMLTAGEKAYRAVLRLGTVTDTQDATGKVIETHKVSVTPDEIEAAVRRFVGEYEQKPPMYSAVKVGGKKLYQLARAGIEVDREARKTRIFSIDILSVDGVDVTFDVRCSKGTYIRTLCQDIGYALGCGGHMASLERTSSGRFDLSSAVALDKLEEAARNGEAERYLIPLDQLFFELPRFEVSGPVEKRVRSGCNARVSGAEPGTEYRVYSKDGEFLCISRAERDGEYTVLRLIKSFC